MSRKDGHAGDASLKCQTGLDSAQVKRGTAEEISYFRDQKRRFLKHSGRKD